MLNRETGARSLTLFTHTHTRIYSHVLSYTHFLYTHSHPYPHKHTHLLSLSLSCTHPHTLFKFTNTYIMWISSDVALVLRIIPTLHNLYYYGLEQGPLRSG
jgi:hypothetical protein